MANSVNIPEFMAKPKEYIRMTREDYNEDRRFVARAAWRQGWIACFKKCICVTLMILLGLGYVAWRISCLPSAEAIEFPVSVEYQYQH